MVNRRMLLNSLLAGGLMAGLAAASASAQPLPYRPVPELRYERVPPPRRGFVWAPGHWRWDGRAYFWVPGVYIAARPEYRFWVHGHWEQRGPNWVWIEPHWE